VFELPRGYLLDLPGRLGRIGTCGVSPRSLVENSRPSLRSSPRPDRKRTPVRFVLSRLALGRESGCRCPVGRCDRHSAACPMLVMAHSGRDSRGFSASCLPSAEPFNVVFGQNRGGREYSAGTGRRRVNRCPLRPANPPPQPERYRPAVWPPDVAAGALSESGVATPRPEKEDLSNLNLTID
jgi:hypothetical protein